MSAPVLSTSPPERRSNPLIWLMDSVGSIWFGVTMLVLIFIYSSIGSAAPPIRQGAMADWTGLELLRFEKSEMEWFSWWPFQLMIALFCLSIIIVTIRRIPLTIVNAGVWAIHSGIVILCVCSVVYFGTKVEGDVAIFQSRALILAPGMASPVSMVVRPQASILVPGATKQYRVSVAQMIPNYELLSGDDKGKKTQAIWFNVESTEPRQFIRVVLVGYPDFTEDVITGPGGGQRAIKVTGQALLDPELQIKLDLDPVTYFYHAHQPPVRSTAAIYARFSPGQEWTQIRYANLPHYSDRLTHRNELWTSPGETLPKARLLDLRPVQRIGETVPDDVDIRITDYLPYAELQRRWTNTGGFLNPMLRFRLSMSPDAHAIELFALDPDRSRIDFASMHFRVEFLWANSVEDRERLTQAPNPRVVVRLPAPAGEQTVELAKLHESAGFAVPGTDYVLSLDPSKTGDPHGSIAIRVKKGEASFIRLLTSGANDGGREVDEEHRPLASSTDKSLQLELVDPSPYRMLFVAGPNDDSVDVSFSRPDGTFFKQRARIGEAVPVMGQSPIVVESLMARASQEVRPMIVPRNRRQSLQNVGKTTSVVRVEINDGQAVQSIWLPFNQYAFDDAQRAQPSRFSWIPRQLRLSDGRTLELLYGRWREPLPSPVALDRFVLQTYPGGDRPSDYISLVRFFEDGGWSPLLEVKSNRPARHGDLWYFQSQWDPGNEAYTVLGVGNRNGVYGMLAGVCISIAGMIYAFYVKPSIIRRRKAAALERSSKTRWGTGQAQEMPEVTHA